MILKLVLNLDVRTLTFLRLSILWQLILYLRRQRSYYCIYSLLLVNQTVLDQNFYQSEVEAKDIGSKSYLLSEREN